MNRRKLTPALQDIAAPWLPHIGGCTRLDGKALARGEKTRVRCQIGDAALTFVEYTSMGEREKARIANLGRQVDARQLTPGVGARRDGATPSGSTSGDYIEYAYTVPIKKKSKTVAALWWDDATAPVGAYLLAYWNDMGATWEPLRDLWSRHA